jgi:hypothetical protein
MMPKPSIIINQVPGSGTAPAELAYSYVSRPENVEPNEVHPATAPPPLRKREPVPTKLLRLLEKVPTPAAEPRHWPKASPAKYEMVLVSAPEAITGPGVKESEKNPEAGKVWSPSPALFGTKPDASNE